MAESVNDVSTVHGNSELVDETDKRC